MLHFTFESAPPFSGDTGFLVFKLATSNIRAWNPNLVDLVATLFATIGIICSMGAASPTCSTKRVVYSA